MWKRCILLLLLVLLPGIAAPGRGRPDSADKVLFDCEDAAQVGGGGALDPGGRLPVPGVEQFQVGPDLGMPLQAAGAAGAAELFVQRCEVPR
jgi:hypothetical protein